MTGSDQPERRIWVGNTEMTRAEVLDALESNVGFAKDSAAAVLRLLGRPSTPEQEQIVREAQRVQGYIGGVLTQLVRALREAESDPPG